MKEDIMQTIHKKVKIAILIRDKINFKTKKSVTRAKEKFYNDKRVDS